MSDLQDKTALVTGAAGFIGGWLAEHLALENGAQVRGLVHPSKSAAWLRPAGVELVAGDVTDAARMREVAAGCDLVFHLAAWLDTPPSADVAWATNVAGTENVLAAAADAERFVYVSSIMVYGAVAAGRVGEGHPYGTWHPTLEPYGATKIEAEHRVFQAFRETGLPITVIRPANVYGPRAGAWLPRGLRRIRVGRPILIGGGRGFAHPVYVKNLVDGLALAAQEEAAIGEAFNISDGVAMTWRDFYARYAELIGRQPRALPTSVAYLLAGIRMLRARFTGGLPSLTFRLVRQTVGRPAYSIEKARRLLGYEPHVSFDEGMAQVAAWYRAGGDLFHEQEQEARGAVYA